MHNTKFDQTKFSTLKRQVSVSKIWIQDYSNSVLLQIYGKRFARVFCCLCQEAGEFITAKAKSGKMR